jgi:hypothetical protein
VTEAQIQAIKQEYAPVYTPRGNFDPVATAQKIAGFSKEFFGDPALSDEGHYHIQGSVPDFHIDVYIDLMSSYRLFYITAPSEFAKTTCCTLIYPVYQIVYFNEPYTVLSGRTDDVSVNFLDLMKEEFEDNRKFRAVFGELRGPVKTHTWNDHKIDLINGSRVQAIPVCGNVRGRRKGQYRPTLFVIDDPEELQDLDSPVVLKKNRNWIKRTVEKRLDRKFGKLRVVGTRIGAGCSIEYCMGDSRWRGKVYKALMRDPKSKIEYSIWEAKWTTAFLKKERQEAIRNKDLESWMYERQNEPPTHLIKDLGGIKHHELQYRRQNDQNVLYDPKDPQFTPIPVFTYASSDPAYKMDSTADERAIIVYALGIQMVKNEFTNNPYPLSSCWVLEYLNNHMDPYLIIDSMMDYHQKYYLKAGIIETIGGGQLFQGIMQRKLQVSDFFFRYPFNPVYVEGQPPNKLRRVFEGLNPKLKMGQLFCRPEHHELIDQMEKFDEEELHLCDAWEMGLRFSTFCNQELRKVSEKTEHLRKAHLASARRTLPPQTPKNMSLNQIMGGIRAPI